MQRPTTLIYNWAIFDTSQPRIAYSECRSPNPHRAPVLRRHPVVQEAHLRSDTSHWRPNSSSQLRSVDHMVDMTYQLSWQKMKLGLRFLQVMMTWDPTHVTKRAKVPILIQVIHPILFHPLLFTVYTFFGSFLTADNLPGDCDVSASVDFPWLSGPCIRFGGGPRWEVTVKLQAPLVQKILHARRCQTKRVNVTLNSNNSTTSTTWLP